MLTTTDLQTYIVTHKIPAELVYPPAATPTVPAATQAMEVLVWRQARSLWS